MLYSTDFSDVDNPARDDGLRPAKATVQDIPAWIIESRRISTQSAKTGGWCRLSASLLLTSDEVECFRDDLSEGHQPDLQYRARLHPGFGFETRVLS